MTDKKKRVRAINPDDPVRLNEGDWIVHPHLTTEPVSMVVGETMLNGKPAAELAGLLLSTDGERIIGAVPGTPAAELGLDRCSELSGVPIDWQHIEQREENVELLEHLGELASAPPAPVDGRQRWRTRPKRGSR